jgi:hypothetical protein
MLLWNDRNTFIICNNGVTGKWWSLCSPCDSYVMQQQKDCWDRYFLCGPCWGYITRRSCNYEKVLRWQWEEWEVGLRQPPACELVSWSNDLVLRQSLTSKDMNTEVEGAMALEVVTRWQPMKIQQTEKTSYVLQWIAECVNYQQRHSYM